MSWLRGARAVIRAVRPFLAEIESVVSTLDDGHFNFAQPRTSVRNAVQQFQGVFQQLDVRSIEPHFASLFKELLARFSSPQILARVRREIAEERRGVVTSAAEASGGLIGQEADEFDSAEEKARFEAASAYLDDLHQRLPYAPAALLFQPAAWTPDYLWDVLRLVHLRRVVRASSGEARAYALEDLARHLTERIYHRYVQTLFFAEFLASGKPDYKPQKFGQHVNSLVGSKATRGLVHPDAAFLRNAASHMERWRLDFAAERVTVENGGAQLIRRDFSLEELESACERMLGEMQAFWTALASHLGERVCDLVMDTKLPEVVFSVMREEPVDDALVQHTRRQLESWFAPIRTRWMHLFPGSAPAFPSHGSQARPSETPSHSES